MGAGDQGHWNERYSALTDAPQPGPPRHFPDLADHLPSAGTAIELACGRGEASVWLAQHGLTVTGYDVSPVAVAAAQRLAEHCSVSDRATFMVADLDEPPVASVPANLVLSHLFLPRYSGSALEALAAESGIIAIAALSEVGAEPGRFRAAPGELLHRFPLLDVIDHTEANGIVRLLARRP